MKRTWERRVGGGAAHPFSIGLGGLAAGAALAYWGDPERGGRRRAEVRQQAVHAWKELGCAVGVTSRDFAHRARGFMAAARARYEAMVADARGVREDDEVVAERVRARLGRLCSHPGAIQVKCEDGRVELKGLVFTDERDRVLRGIAAVRGVREIDDDLDAHATAKSVAALQGEGHRPTRPELLQVRWSPTTRALVGMAGAGLAGWGAARRSAFRAGAGLALLLRSLTNLSTRRLVGVGAGPRAIDLRKDIHVDAPPDQVFEHFRRFENFPRFMSHVRKVEPRGEGRWLWNVTGPANVPVSWEAEVIREIPGKLIAWESVPGSVVKNAGVIHFEPDRGGTRIGIRLSYNPPAGAIGHSFAKVLGADPKKQLDDDMVRFKSLIENGKATGHDGPVTSKELFDISLP
ncbi:MAG TPA: SRPBCC family protein [Myxococcaceae bacterium]|jgi:uncharacterized membrane protein